MAENNALISGKVDEAQSYGPTVHGDEWQVNAFRIHLYLLFL